jgi:hypothetical protein
MNASEMMFTTNLRVISGTRECACESSFVIRAEHHAYSLVFFTLLHVSFCLSGPGLEHEKTTCIARMTSRVELLTLRDSE